MSRSTYTLAAALLAAAFGWAAWSAASADSVGALHDDTLYLAAGKALAEGSGLKAPNLPGEPPLTKYPPLYPALLSLAWRAAPAYPDVLAWAWALNALLGAAAILVSAALFRQLGAGRGEALGLTAVVAFNPYLRFWASTLVSDTAFFAFAVGAAVLASRALAKRPEGAERWSWAAAVALLWAACLTRTLGVAFVAGVALEAVRRRAWGRAAAASSAALPVAWGLLGGAARRWPALEGAAEGYRQNLLYYASYAEFWKLSVPDWETFQAQIWIMLGETVKHPAVAVFDLPITGFVAGEFGFVATALASAVSLGIVAGVAGRARAAGATHPIHGAALAYLPIVLLWNYPIMGRFWLPFTPLFVAGAAWELRRIAGMTRETWRRGPAGDRIVAAGFASAVLALVAYGAYRMYVVAPPHLAGLFEERARLAVSKREAYEWLAANMASGEPAIAYEDAALYLAAGRPAMRPLSVSTESFFRQAEAPLERDLAGIADTAAAVGARYWLVAPDDYELEHAPERVRTRIAETLEGVPVVFESADGQVRVHELAGPAWAAATVRASGVRYEAAK